MTNLSGTLFRGDSDISSRTLARSNRSTLPSYPLMGLTTTGPALPQRKRETSQHPAQLLVTASTPENAQTLVKRAHTDTSVPSASNMDMAKVLVRWESDLMHGLQPRYLRYNIWCNDGSSSLCAANWTITAAPLPPPPPAELSNPLITSTLESYPYLFDIVMPIKVDRFEALLVSHPNQPFVQSICQGLRHGFWPPGANTHAGIYSDTHDASLPTPSDPTWALFIKNQCDIEVHDHRFSAPFGQTLLPGMYCMPAYAVPKPNSSDLRLITDQSASPFSLNSMIPQNTHATYPLDNLHLLDEVLLSPYVRNLHNPILFKSDVAIAYRLMPMHPAWQIKQAMCVNGNLHIDRCGVIGGRKTGDLSVPFHSLICWIAREIKGIPHLVRSLLICNLYSTKA